MPESPNRDRPPSFTFPPLWIALTYLVVAYAWILGSDYLLFFLDQSILWVSMAKGLGFVTVTAAVLYVLIARRERQLQTVISQLKHSDDLVRHVISKAPIILWAVDAEGRITLSRGAGLASLGLKPDELVGRNVFEIYANDALIVARLRRALSGEVFTTTNELGGVALETHYSPVRAEGAGSGLGAGTTTGAGKVTGVIGVSIDVTERVRAERASAESRRFLLNALQVGHIGGWTSELGEGAPISWTDENYRIFGVPPGTPVTVASFFQLVHPDDRKPVQDAVALAVQNDSPYATDHRIIRPDGTERWVHERADVVREEGRPPRLIGVTMDITDRKYAEIALRRQNDLRRLLLSELDHRVKNALAGLLTMVDLSRQRREEQFADAIRAHILAMLAVHSMLSSRHWTDVDLAALITALIPPGSAKRVTLEGPPTSIPARQATAMGMVIQELFSNSVKHGSLGDGSPAGHVRISWSFGADPINGTPSAGEAAPSMNGSGVMSGGAIAQPPSAGPRITGRRFHFRWSESGGPSPVPAPEARTGTSLIEGFARSELCGTVQFCYPQTGADHLLTLGLDDPESGAPGSNDETSV
ncbi:MAG TPA: PAS domain S-box protein [Phycisphaerales bacterium]|nr:PAS domain S-box protein [Phycisphaerales bacterium]